MDISKTRLSFTLACRWFSPADQGGVAMHNGYLIETLKNSMNVQVLTLEDDKNRAYYKQRGIPFVGIPTSIPTLAQRLAKTFFLKNGLRAWQDWRISLAIAKALEASPTDVVEFMDIQSEAYAYLRRNPKGKRKTKVVIRSHTPWSLLRTTYFPEEIRGVDGWWAQQREQFCFDNCDAITTPSKDLKKQLVQLFQIPAEKITVIPNLLDTTHFHPFYIDNGNNEIRLLHVGRFERSKGVITLIKAFAETCKQVSNLKLINVGKPRGKELEACLDILRKNQLINQVEFAGFVDYDELPSYYQNADIVLVTPEIYESFSYTAAQALACGKATILSDSGGMPETANYGQCGYLFKRGSVEELTEAILKLTRNKSLKKQFEKKGREFANENFSIQALRNTYCEFYAKLVTT